tara:strand:+ start:228 stop:743 length:516 start_codon:yes stop_codon:yes gene_type:complete
MDGYKEYVVEVPDFPIEGVSFKDISPILENEDVFRSAIVRMGDLVDAGFKHLCPDYWVGVDARGFIFASALAVYFGGGVVMVRKKGKLPPPTKSYGYKTEYSEDTLEIKEGTGDVIIVDDVLATGGTLQVVNDLCESAGYQIKDNLVLIDLEYVPRVKWFNTEVKSLIQYG